MLIHRAKRNDVYRTYESRFPFQPFDIALYGSVSILHYLHSKTSVLREQSFGFLTGPRRVIYLGQP